MEMARRSLLKIYWQDAGLLIVWMKTTQKSLISLRSLFIILFECSEQLSVTFMFAEVAV